MAFTPDNELEQIMLHAAAEPAARPDFYRFLLASNLIVLGSFGDTMQIETVANETGRYHPAFTSPARMKEFVPAEMSHFAISARNLFEVTRGAQFVLNPGSGLSKVLAPEEVAWCLKTFPPATLRLMPPKQHPATLIKALCVLFTSRSLIRAAHLVHVVREGIDKTPHPLIGLIADGDLPRLAKEIMIAAAAACPGIPVEIIRLDPQGTHDPLQIQMLSTPPFYRRLLPIH